MQGPDGGSDAKLGGQRGEGIPPCIWPAPIDHNLTLNIINDGGLEIIRKKGLWKVFESLSLLNFIRTSLLNRLENGLLRGHILLSTRYFAIFLG